MTPTKKTSKLAPVTSRQSPIPGISVETIEFSNAATLRITADPAWTGPHAALIFAHRVAAELLASLEVGFAAPTTEQGADDRTARVTVEAVESITGRHVAASLLRASRAAANRS